MLAATRLSKQVPCVLPLNSQHASLLRALAAACPSPSTTSRIAFRWLLVADDLFSTLDLSALNRVVVGLAGRVLGAVSRKISLSHVVEPFLKCVSACVWAGGSVCVGGGGRG